MTVRSVTNEKETLRTCCMISPPSAARHYMTTDAEQRLRNLSHKIRNNGRALAADPRTFAKKRGDVIPYVVVDSFGKVIEVSAAFKWKAPKWVSEKRVAMGYWHLESLEVPGRYCLLITRNHPHSDGTTLIRVVSVESGYSMVKQAPTALASSSSSSSVKQA